MHRLAAAPWVKTWTERLAPSIFQLFWQFEGQALSLITFMAASPLCECGACISTQILQQKLSCVTISGVLSLYYPTFNLTSGSAVAQCAFISTSTAVPNLILMLELFLHRQLASSQSPYDSCTHPC